MYRNLPHEITTFQLLHRIDARTAEACWATGCPWCGGPLLGATYGRKPRGGPEGAPKEVCLRLEAFATTSVVGLGVSASFLLIRTPILALLRFYTKLSRVTVSPSLAQRANEPTAQGGE